MRLLAASWLLGLSVVLLVAVSATRVQLNANVFAVQEASGLGFSDYQEVPMPQSLLAAVEYGTLANQNLIKCDVTEITNNSGQATVLVAISKCLNASSIALIGAWVDTIKTSRLEYVENGVKKKLTFDTTLVNGDCTAASDGNTQKNSPYKSTLLSEKLQPDEMDRIQAFARFGRVLAEAPSAWNATPIAVVSFTDDRRSHDTVTQYLNRFNISKTFRFQFCGGSGNCTDRFQNSVVLDQSVDLFMYNPFQVIRSEYCGHLIDGLPVQYINKNGTRDCMCSCSATSYIADSSYGKRCIDEGPPQCVCSWNFMGGFVVNNTEKLTQCKMSNLASARGLPVPVPRDNYVADQRNLDELTTGPRIELTTTSLYSTVHEYNGTAVVNLKNLSKKETEMLAQLGRENTRVVFKPTVLRGQNDTKKFTWLDYRQNDKAKIDDLTLTAYGKYELVLTAYDYQRSAECVGCVAVVDGYRPKRTTQCPVPYRDNSTQTFGTAAELTAGNVVKAVKLVSDFYDFQAKAENDACSSDVKTRCDYQDFKVKTLFSSNFTTKNYTNGKTCFSTAEIEADLVNGGTTNPLVSKARDGTACQDDAFVVPKECTRCCKYETRLREYWTDYRCGYDYSMQYCSGDDNETCAFQQCLVLTGPSIANASASIKPTIAKNSADVIKSVSKSSGSSGLQTTTQVHWGLTCSTLGNSCNLKTTMESLFDVSVVNKVGNATSNFVFWRYTLSCDNVKWRLWNPASPITHTIKEKSVVVTMEAWTACGFVYSTKFTIYVYVTRSGQYQQLTAAAHETTASSGTTPALIALSAVVLAAAFVAVRRRQRREKEGKSTVTMEDAYRPLLE